MKLKEIMEKLDKLCPFATQEDFDNSGLQVGALDKECGSILLAFDFTEAVLEEAIKRGTDLIITHHPFLFTPLKSIRTDHWKGKQVFRLIREDIALAALHTNLDKEPQFGVSIVLGHRLGLKKATILLPEVYPEIGDEVGFGCIGDLEQPMAYGDFLNFVKETLQRPTMKYVGDETKTVQRIAVSGGSCAEFMEDAQTQGADVFICGDLKYHDAQRAQENGMCLVDASHFGTEVWALEAFQETLRKEFPSLSVEIAESIGDYWNYRV